MKKYDVKTMEPPHEFITVGEFECEDVERNEDGLTLDNGEAFYRLLRQQCALQGHTMRFYTSGDDNYDYKVVVEGEFEETDKYKRQDLKNSLRFSSCMAYCKGDMTLEETREVMKIPDIVYPKV